eukprot:m.87318 g.87318  ORF g.87318 m.87318 type:complete len:56 (+) comp36540_c0_seq17:1663-1830(+)
MQWWHTFSNNLIHRPLDVSIWTARKHVEMCGISKTQCTREAITDSVPLYDTLRTT